MIPSVSFEMVIIQFGLSGAATVLVAAALREALLQLGESRAAEAAVQANLVATEARFRMLADSAPVLMWLSHADGTREFVNRAYLDFLGLDGETALAFDWQALIHPDDPRAGSPPRRPQAWPRVAISSGRRATGAATANTPGSARYRSGVSRRTASSAATSASATTSPTPSAPRPT